MPLKSWADLLDDAGGAGNDFEPLPDGDYDFVISECEAKQSSTGKTMYVAKCQVEAGPSKGRLVWHNFVVVMDNPNALSWFFRNMNLLGLDRAFWDGEPGDHQVAQNLKGKRFRGQVITKTWNNSERNEIKQFFSARATAPGPGSSNVVGPAPVRAAAPAAPAPAPAPAFAAPAPAAAPPQPAPPAPAAPAPAPIQQEAAAAPPAPAAPPVEVAAPPAPPAPPAAGGDTPPPPPPF